MTTVVPNDLVELGRYLGWDSLGSIVRPLSTTRRCDMHPTSLDAAGHPRQPVTMPGYHAGRPLGTGADATPQTRQPSRRSWP